MSYQDLDQQDLPARGKPKQAVNYTPKHALVLRALRKGPLTDVGTYDRITEFQGRVISPSGCRTRRAELVEMGLVRFLAKRAGHSVWALTDTGKAKANAEFEASRQSELNFQKVA